MSSSPAFQYYPAAVLSSAKVAIMTTEQFGAYWLLISYAWLDPDCTIPDDDEQLALMTRLGEGWLKGASKVVRACFEPHPQIPGRLVNLRLYEERIKQAEWREKSAAGGRRSAETRRAKALKELKGGSRVVEPPLPNGSNQKPTKGQLFSLQSSVSEERGVSDNEDFSANAELPSEKKAPAKANADAPKDPLPGEADKVARWLAKLVHGAAEPESRARLNKQQILALRTEAKRLKDDPGFDADLLPDWKRWYDGNWRGKKDKQSGSRPNVGVVRSTWSEAFPDADADDDSDDDIQITGKLA